MGMLRILINCLIFCLSLRAVEGVGMLRPVLTKSTLIESKANGFIESIESDLKGLVESKHKTLIESLKKQIREVGGRSRKTIQLAVDGQSSLLRPLDNILFADKS